MRRIGSIALVVVTLATTSFAAPPTPGQVHRAARRNARRAARHARVRVRVAPPPLRVIERTAAPSPKHVYVAGYWSWDPVKVTHVWVDPVWKLPPHAGEVWHAGHWEKDGDEWEWEEGEWEDVEDHAEHAKGSK